MTTESQHHNVDQQVDIQDWIRTFQQDSENEHAQRRLIQEYEGLVHSLARRFSKGKNIHDDLVQVGMIGLLTALRRFDYTSEHRFESFAVPTIIGEIKRFIRDKTWSVHVPRRIKELGPRIRKAAEELTNEFERSPNVGEIADYLDASEEEVLEAMEMGKSYQALSVDSMIEADSEGSTVTLLDLVSDQDDDIQQTDHRMLLEKLFRILPEREQDILRCTYFEGLSQKETGNKLGISQMHVSRLQRRALQKLRKTIRIEPSEALK